MPQQLDPTVLTSAGHTPSFQITQILCSIHSKLQLPELSAESTHERQFTWQVTQCRPNLVATCYLTVHRPAPSACLLQQHWLWQLQEVPTCLSTSDMMHTVHYGRSFVCELRYKHLAEFFSSKLAPESIHTQQSTKTVSENSNLNQRTCKLDLGYATAWVHASTKTKRQMNKVFAYVSCMFSNKIIRPTVVTCAFSHTDGTRKWMGNMIPSSTPKHLPLLHNSAL